MSMNSLNENQEKEELFQAIQDREEKMKERDELLEKCRGTLEQPKAEAHISLFNVDIINVVAVGIDLNMLYLLERAYIAPLKVDYNFNAKIKGWEQTLIRKGFLTEEGEITEEGRKVYTILSSQRGEKVVQYKKEKKEKKVKVETDFDRWWNAFPASDNFVYKNKKFTGSRSMRIKKDLCVAKFKEIISEGKYTADDIIRGTENQVDAAKEESYRRGVNKVSYITNSERYLRERAFEPFIEMETRKKDEDDFRGEVMI